MQLTSFTTSFKKTPTLEKVLCVSLAAYLLMGYVNMPEYVAEYIDTILGKVIIGGIVVYLFMYTHTVTACLALFTAFMILANASNMTGNDALARFNPTGARQSRQLAALNLTAFPYTLEEEIVTKSVQPRTPIGNMADSSVQALSQDTHNAAPVS